MSPIPYWSILAFIFCTYVGSLSYSLQTLESVENLREQRSPVKIAIVGGGIGGTSNAFFLRDLFGEDAAITLFEKGTIGGRLATVSIAGAQYEMGGSIVHPRNLYMKQFLQDFGLKERETKGTDGTLGIFNGEEFIFKSSRYSILTLIKMLWRYGFDIFRLNWTIDKVLDKFARIYDFQDGGQSFTDIEGIMNAMGGEEFIGWLRKPLGVVLREEGFSERFIQELAAIATRANYGQNLDMMGFAGMVSLAGAMPGLWSIEGGNKRVPQQLLQRSGATLMQSQVQSVERVTGKSAEKPIFRVTWNEPAKGDQSIVFDIVMIASPIEDNLSGIAFSGFDHPITANFTGDYRHTVASFIEGHQRPSTFGVSPKGQLPGSIFTNAEVPLNIRTLAKNYPVDYNPETFNASRQVYKIFSTGVLNDTQMDSLFESYSEATHHDWLAYPYYHERNTFPGFVLSEGLFYPNAIEWAASAMEMAVIGSRNSAILAYHYWHGESPKGKVGTSRIRQEL
ncbi:prenylcysteine oxidase 1-like [Lytechinus pictus]|uniref:prenylcysteine oxidase 1-like n=1 Tax=Lytechinus pictus TaxID=7653 RepID=UPI0030B9ED3F